TTSGGGQYAVEYGQDITLKLTSFPGHFLRYFYVDGEDCLDQLQPVNPAGETESGYQTYTHRVTKNFTVKAEFSEGEVIKAEGDQLVCSAYEITFSHPNEDVTNPILRQTNNAGKQVVFVLPGTEYTIKPLSPYTHVRIPGVTYKKQKLVFKESLHLTRLELSQRLFGPVALVEMDLKIEVDNDAPKVDFLPETATSDGYYNKDFAVNVNVKDLASGIKSVSYVIKNKGLITSGEEPLIIYKRADEEPILNVFQTQIKVPAAVNNSDNVMLEVTVTDIAGNTHTVKSEQFKVNSVAPEIAVKMIDQVHSEAVAGYYQRRQAEITIVDRADTFDPQKATSGITFTAKDASGKEIAVAPIIEVSDWQSSGNTHVGTVDFSEDANYEWSINYTNKAGLSNSGVETTGKQPFRFTIDKTAPTGTISFDKGSGWNRLVEIITFGIWRNTDMTARADASDATAGVKSILYYQSSGSSALQRNQLESLFKDGKFGEQPITVKRDKAFVVYARITDKAGNTTYISTDGAIVDKTNAVIELTDIGDKSAAGFYNDNFKVKVTVNDNRVAGKDFSGLRSVDYKVTNAGQVTARGNLYTFTNKQPQLKDLKQSYTGQITIDATANDSDDVAVTVVAVDNAGNRSEATLKLKINVNQPEISVYFDDQIGGLDDDWGYFAEPREAVIRVVDRASTFDAAAATAGIVVTAIDESGNIVEPAPITVADWQYVPEEETDIYETTVVFPGDYTYKWDFSYTNKADSVNQEIFDVIGDSPFAFVVDTTAPTGTVEIEGHFWDRLLEILTFGLYSPDTVAVTCSAEDNISPVTIEYLMTDGTKSYSVEELEEEIFSVYEEPLTIENDKVFVVYMKITDLAGHVTFISSDGFIVDKTKADLQVTPAEPNAYGIYNTDVPVQIKTTDGELGSGIKRVRYWVKVGDRITQAETLYETEDTQPQLADLRREWSGEFVVSGSNNSSNTEVFVEVVDNADNQSIQKITLDIDITPPAVVLRYDNNLGQNGYFQAQRTATLTVVERQNHFNPEEASRGINITAVNAKGEDVLIDQTLEISDWYFVAGDTPDTDRHWTRIQFDVDANYTFDFTYTDNAGNEATDPDTTDQTAPFEFTVDTVAPTGNITAVSAEGRSETWETLISDLTFGFYTASQIDLTASVSDETSGIASVDYYLDTSGQPMNAEKLGRITTWKPFDHLTLKPNRQAVLYLKIQDKAGHITYRSSDGLMLDNSAPRVDYLAPSITLSPGRSTNGFFNGDVVVDVRVEDPIVNNAYSGIKTIRYEVMNMGQVTATGTLYSFIGRPVLSQLRRTWNGTLTVNHQANNSNDVTVRVFAEDNVGNTVWESTALQIDTTPPIISVSYNNNGPENGDYYNSDRVATIVITERNFDPADVKLTVTNSLGTVPSLSGWSHSAGGGNGDQDRHTATLAFAADGDYTFDIAYTDRAGNASSGVNFAAGTTNPQAFTVDKTPPTANVSYDNNDVQNEHFFSAPRTASVTVTERNFDPSLVEFTVTGNLDGSSIGVPSPSWSSSGDSHTATLHFADDGDYTLDVTMRDQAGNAAADISFSGAAAQSFTVDQTIVAPVIDGVKDGQSYTEDVIPIIHYSDRNFADIDVRLLRTRRNEIDVDVTSEYVATARSNDGGTHTLDAFIHKPEIDGIYTLTATITDKAGNAATEEIVFTVNRFGSVYVYGDYLNRLLDTYQQEIEQDLVITEYNPDRLVKDSVKVQISRDGTPLPDVNYMVAPTINNRTPRGTSGWYQYEYRISPMNFSEDGIYKLAITSADTAGNQPESTAAVGSEILFRVDTTPAEITDIRGLEEPIINAGEQVVEFDVFDAIGLQSISVFVSDTMVAN
ncbi:MAG TPA: hypothetical protein GX717_06215, partial [Clostridiaceae bacterium]|nr:hypothetical protein [Clostridiaceae bacterium]